ncbi:MAG: aminomethyl-transferring glycine dehydrogenase subunit GcvPA [Deltaproteobacteria bacterium]|nr:aminomethyl-transferring glycine dehydrogenase subunit GcvPA [Deltaproteobacteria bacterium]
MRYIPHTTDDVRRMLEAIGVASVEQLFDSIPSALKLSRDLALPTPMDEVSLTSLLRGLAARNAASADRMALFLGAGAYAHHIPAAVDQLLLRGEFFTAYTPYQSEASQGTLQSIFEYQSMVASLLGADAVNASMYDGASATAEAVLMGLRLKRKRPRVLVARSVHPEVGQTCRTYLSEHEPGLEEVPFTNTGTTDLDSLKATLDDEVSSVVIQSPNALGCIEPLDRIADLVHAAGGLLIAVVLEPVSLGLLRTPGELGADIITGEGMGLGSGLHFGGPGLGLFGVRGSRNVWQMPGRLVGQTSDAQGRTGYVLTMASREQHIRRARATSNICTNEGLCMLAAAIHLSLLGKQGFGELARINATNARALLEKVERVAGVERVFPAPFFNEFVIRVDGGAERALARLSDAGILGGLPAHRFFPELDSHLIVCATECNTHEQLSRYAETLAGQEVAS